MTIENQESCCVVLCERPLDQNYWEAQYQAEATGWDLGQVSPPLKAYIDQYTKKQARILIAGAGNAYEADYLLEQGFEHITVIDIAPSLVESLQAKYAHKPQINIILGDFFEHEGTYDLILEQTFFCAIPPSARQRYVGKMHQLLAEGGKLVGVLFDREFTQSPPFGGNIALYQTLFQHAFHIHTLAPCENSIQARQGTEAFFIFEKNAQAVVHLYHFEGITCTGCMNTVMQKFTQIAGVLQAQMSSDYSEVLLVSDKPVELSLLEEAIQYDAKYHIRP